MVRALVDITEAGKRTSYCYRLRAGACQFVDARDLPGLGRARCEIVEP